jgi:hypothetical protein
MPLARSKIDGATEDIEKTWINANAHLFAALFVQALGAFSIQIGNTADAKFPQIFGNALPNTGDGLKFSENRGFVVDRWQLEAKGGRRKEN